MELSQIFYVHSNITYLAALSVIQERKIQNPVLLFGRNYKNNLIENNFHKVYLDQSINALNLIPSYGGPLLIFRYARSLRHLRVVINKYGGKGYACYVPHVQNFLMQYFVMHKYCRQFGILEEGLLSHMDYKSFIKQTNPGFSENISGKIIRFIKYLNHLNSSSVYFPIKARLNGIYLFYNPIHYARNHNNQDKIQTLKWPEIKAEVPDYSNKSIFIFDNLESDNFLDVNNYLPIYRSIFGKYFKSEIYVKFHPANKKSQALLDILDSLGINYHVIDLDTPLELVFVKSKNLKVYGLFSSLLFYATITGHQSFSYAKHAEKFDDRIELMMSKLMPQVFFEKVKML